MGLELRDLAMSSYLEALIVVIARERFRDKWACNVSLDKGVRVYIGAHAGPERLEADACRP